MKLFIKHKNNRICFTVALVMSQKVRKWFSLIKKRRIMVIEKKNYLRKINIIGMILKIEDI